MKKSGMLLIFALSVVATNAHASSCDVLLNHLKGWLATENTLVRVVTTFNEDGNHVTYTRGYLYEDENVSGMLTASSLRYSNESPDHAFNEASTDHVTISLLHSSEDRIQVNYFIDANPGANVGYLAQCTPTMLFFVTDSKVLTVSFRKSSI